MFTIFDFAIYQSLINLLQHSPSLLSAAGLSYVVAEFGRDVFHVLGHKVTWFWNNFHRFHHLLYRAGWKVNPNPRIVRLERIRHQLAETTLMFLTTAVFTGLLAWLNPSLALGSLYGVYYTLSNLLRVVFDILTDAPHQLDKNHTPKHYSAPPSYSFWVDQQYHDPHHFGDLFSAYSGVVKILDPLIGTARSLKKSIGILGLDGELSNCLGTELSQEGGAVTFMTNAKIKFTELDILAIDGTHPLAVEWSQDFFDTINTNSQFANSELWVFIPFGVHVSNTIAQIHHDAPVIVRKFYLSKPTSPVWQAKAALFWASRDVRRMIL